ncbi:hypothetical protein [Streptomyces griseoaurantiacus]
MRVYAKYFSGLIALYLVVYNGSKSGIVMKEGAAGVSKVAKTLQGR